MLSRGNSNSIGALVTSDSAPSLRLESRESSDYFRNEYSPRNITSGKFDPLVNLPSVPVKSLNVLLVDDAMSIIKMTSMLLKRNGHTVTVAENGAEALLNLQEVVSDDRSRQYDVVLMDIQMPVMDGLEATKRWREIECPALKAFSRRGSELLVFSGVCCRVCYTMKFII